MNNIANEIVFLIEEDPEGGYTAKGLGESIFTQAKDMASLKEIFKPTIAWGCKPNDTKKSNR